MKHYEERLEHDLQEIRDAIVAVGRMAADALPKAVQALLERDLALASETILGDHPINRKTRAIDRKCHAFVALHLPSAGPLRFVSSVLRLNVALERIGDYASTIAKHAVQLDAKPPEVVRRDISMMADQAAAMLKQAMQSFAEGNAELARGTMKMADQVDATFDNVLADLVRETEAGATSVRDSFALLVVFNRLERISDQAKNICEETVFAATGDTKAPKRYGVLFVDERNDARSVMATAIAARAFPESGRYASAGWSPAAAVDPDVVGFMAPRVDLSGTVPTQLDTTRESLDGYHVVVGLEPGLRDRIPELPFQTVLVEWRLESPADDLEATYRELSMRIRDLMVTLRGEEAS